MQADDSGHQHLTEHDVLRLAKEALDKGRTKQQVFEELAPRFYSTEYLAQLISTIPDVELRKVFRGTNRALVVVMLMASASHAGLLWLAMLSKGFTPLMVLDHIIPLLIVLLARRVWRMSVHAYVPVGWLSLLGILDAVRLARVSPLWSLVDMALFVTAGCLSFHVKGHLFPHHRSWTSPPKDESGNYLL